MQPIDVFPTRFKRCFIIVMLHAWKWMPTNCEHQEVCGGKDFVADCGNNEAILMEKATFGRMSIGKCVHTDFGYIGCKNNVLNLADRWCSGLRHCIVEVSNDDLDEANTACSADLNSYLEATYSCTPVITQEHCSSRTKNKLHRNHGYISSHVTAETGCGSPKAPWLIEAQSGQTIDLWLIDFGALDREEQSLYTSCHQLYGFIIERDLGVNLTMCGGTERKKQLYKSKTNKVEVHVLSQQKDTARYLIQYTFAGCADLTPPTHAWYKREGNSATFGCKSNSNIWHLNCNGNTWDGVVGNCSEISTLAGGKIHHTHIPFSTVIILTCVVCGALLLVIVVVVAGVVYVRKQSIKHDLKLRTEYGFGSTAAYYTMTAGYDVGTIGSGHGARHLECQTLVKLVDKDTIDTNTSQSSGPGTAMMKQLVLQQAKKTDDPMSDRNLM